MANVGTARTTVTVRAPRIPNTNIVQNIEVGNFFRFDLAGIQAHVTGSNIENIGIEIASSTSSITVLTENKDSRGCSAFKNIPNPNLGKDYFIMTSSSSAQATILATSSGTTVITVSIPTSASIRIFHASATYSAGQSFNINLLQYQTATIVGSGTSLSGSRVTGDKNFALFSGNRGTNTANPIVDSLSEQLYPVETWGKEFWVYLPSGAQSATVRILSLQAAQVRVSGKSLINIAGPHDEKTVQLDNTSPSTGHYITSSQNIQVALEVRSTFSSSPTGVIMIPPLSQWNFQHTFIIPTEYDPASFALKITSTGRQVYLDGRSLDLSYNGNLKVTSQTTLHFWLNSPITPGRHIIQSTQPVFVSVNMENSADTCSIFYSAGQCLKNIYVPPTTVAPTPPPTTPPTRPPVPVAGSCRSGKTNLGREFFVFSVVSDTADRRTKNYPSLIYPVIPETSSSERIAFYIGQFSATFPRTYDRPFKTRFSPVAMFTSSKLEASYSGINIYRVNAQADIAVFAVNQAKDSCGGYMALPSSVNGRDFRVVTDIPKTGISFLAVIAKSSTTVTITLRAPTTFNGNNYKAGDTLTQNVLDNNVLYLSSNGDLTGSRIQANNPVSVFSGNSFTSYGNGVEADHMIENMPPTSLWGMTFVLNPIPERVNSYINIFKVVAREDNTVVSVDGQAPFSINAGESRLVRIASSVWSFMYSNKPVLAVQLSQSKISVSDTGSPTMITVSPAELWLNSYTFMATVGNLEDVDKDFIVYVIVVIEDGKQSGLRINNGQIPSQVTWSKMSGRSYVGAYVNKLIFIPSMTGLYNY